jgi:hypothetical protein
VTFLSVIYRRPTHKLNYGTDFDVFVKCSRPFRMRAKMTLPQQQSKRPGAQPANTWMNWSWLWSEARPALAPRALCRTGVSWPAVAFDLPDSEAAAVRPARAPKTSFRRPLRARPNPLGKRTLCSPISGYRFGSINNCKGVSARHRPRDAFGKRMGNSSARKSLPKRAKSHVTKGEHQRTVTPNSTATLTPGHGNDEPLQGSVTTP